MGLFKLAAAVALMVGSLGLSSTASAQRHDDHRGRIEHSDRRGDARRPVIRRDDRRDGRRYSNNRRYNNDRRYSNNRRYAGRRDVRGRHCTTVWRNNRHVQTCR
ncbi:hypothetical protein [Sphingobium sp. HWE2-09]|uniref:hypothetical protein n=1 Tax=Sphingobium sp. HWE2-09 TaxID=3108390 RepID=UPI002DCB4B77|nr:hypothetical protein [Sphingobium sp. HWE2-09]